MTPVCGKVELMSLPSISSAKYGVIFLPFQTHFLSDVHAGVIDDAIQAHEHVIIALPVRRITPSKRSPLTFQVRERLITQTYGDVTIVAVPDTKYPEDKIKALENAVRAPFSEMRGSVALYTSDTFASLYTTNGGKWKTTIVPDILKCEEQARRLAQKAPVVNTDQVLGIIQGLNQQFPISWSTVDICIYRRVAGKTMILLGKKPGERGWRFPGGFKDREDPSYEVAVLREAGEEILRQDVDPKTVMREPEYIGSLNINDWRYVDEIDGITTLFYAIEFTGTDDQIEANDDIAESQWFAVDQLTEDIMEGEHKKLLALMFQVAEKKATECVWAIASNF